MLMLGIVALVIAAILIVFGIANAAVHALIWVGVALVVVAVVLIVLTRTRGPRTPV